MNQKKYKNSIIIEGDYSYNYLTNLLFLAQNCIVSIFNAKKLDPKKDKKILKNISNLSHFLVSSVEVFSRLSVQENENRCILHNVEYVDGQPKVQFDLLDKLSDDVIKKNKEVDDKYNEEN